MPTQKINDDTFAQDVLENDKPVIVDFWAEWCGPCKALGPILENLSEEYANKIDIKKLNIDENQENAGKFGIRSIPTMLLFKDGKHIDTKVGLLSENDLKSWIDQNI